MPTPPAPTPADRLRVVVVGARQSRHGLGAFLARHLSAAGAEVVAVVGGRLATAMAAADALTPVLGHRPMPLAHSDDVERLPHLSALVIASPHETHEAWLRWAVGHGLSVLCEKPLVWGGPSPATAAGALARRFEQRGLHLKVNAQWPHVLPAFQRLHPDVDLKHVRRLELDMQPPSRGAEMLPDSVPHALSLAYALAPHAKPRLEDVRATWADEDGHKLTLTWTHVAGERRLSVEARLTQGGASPRRFALTLDGLSAVREVDPATYAMRLVDGGRSVPLADPMATLVEGFVREVLSGAAPTTDPSASFGVAHLAQLAEAVPALPITEIPFP